MTRKQSNSLNVVCTLAFISCSGQCPTQMWCQPSGIHSIFWGFRSSGRWRLGLLGCWMSGIYVLLKPRESATDTASHVRMSESSATPLWEFQGITSNIFSQSRVIQLLKKFIWPTGTRQSAIVVLWKKQIVLSCDKFSVIKKKKKTTILRLRTRRIQNYFCGVGHREVVVTGYAASCLLKGPWELWILDIATSLLWDAVSCIL